MDIKKEYSKGDVTVVWKPGLCIHSKKCVEGLPQTFKPNEKPWIQVDNSNSADLMATIDTCPSGALSYMKATQDPEKDMTGAELTKVEVLENGPLMVSGTIEVKYFNGETETKKRNTAFCRCGKTGNVPFCDGSHNTN